MRKNILAIVQLSLVTILFAGVAGAFEANQVTITEAESFNSGNHMWFKISGNSTCGSAYFILQRWDDQPEPVKTQRQVMYQIALTAFASGKNIRVIGSTCYLSQYLFADHIIMYQ